MILDEKTIKSYYVHFWTNISGKGMNPLILLAVGQIIPLLFF